MHRGGIACTVKVYFSVIKGLCPDPGLKKQSVLSLVDIRNTIPTAFSSAAAMLINDGITVLDGVIYLALGCSGKYDFEKKCGCLNKYCKFNAETLEPL